ncbi:MAG: GTPase HflX, partial [Ruminiclostridium sp.]|nr:GTPase HflX [Ruminiclostridium sp.]
MNEQIKNENEKNTRAVLAGIDTGEYDAEISMDELEELAKTAGAITVCRLIQKRPTIESATILGEGKIAELADMADKLEADLIIFDMELSSSQIRNIEDITSVRVIDRTMLILDIFAGRAVTNEGKLQVELAQLKYRLPRLMGIGASLSRLGGGIGTRGPGETQLDTDRRHIRRRIEKLTEELRELEKRRDQARRRRKKDSVIVGAIVGYTNAGKSTLLNALTNADVLAEDKLFATLDLTSRAIELPDGRSL